MATYTRPTFVTAGDQWWSGMTEADYQKTLQPGGVNYKATTTSVTPTPSPTSSGTTSLASPTTTAPQPGTTAYNTAVQDITSQFNTLQQRIATEGITDSSGTYLKAPEGKTLEEMNNTQNLQTSQQQFTSPAPTAQTSSTSYDTGLMAQLEQQRTTLESAYKEQLAATQKSLEEAKTAYQDALAQQKSAIDMADPTKEATYAQEQLIRQNQLDAAQRASEDLVANYEAKQKLVSELESLLTGINNQVLAEKSVTGLASIREPRTQLAIDQANSRIGVINASLAAYDGQYSLASKMIDDAANAVAADRRDRLNYYNALQSFYGGQADTANAQIVQLTKDEKTWIASQVSLLENDLAQTQQNVEYIKQQMMDPDTAKIYGEAGVTLNMSPEQIQQKLKEYGYTQEVRTTSNDMGQKGYTYSADGSVPAGYESVTTTDSRGVTKTWIKKQEIKTPDMMGSAEGGYYQWNPTTGKWELTIAGTGRVGDELEDLLVTYSNIAAMKEEGRDREYVLSAIENSKTVLLSTVGEDGYKKVLAEVDRLFPTEDMGDMFTSSQDLTDYTTNYSSSAVSTEPLIRKKSEGTATTSSQEIDWEGIREYQSFFADLYGQ